MKNEHPTSRTDPIPASTLDTRHLLAEPPTHRPTETPMLTLFTRPSILRQIDSRRFEKLFGCFRDDLKTCNVLLPTPESENGSYFDTLAAALAASAASLPERLRATLLGLEAATTPENAGRLDDAIVRRIPNVAVSETSSLDRALNSGSTPPKNSPRSKSEPPSLSPTPPNHRPTETLNHRPRRISHPVSSIKHRPLVRFHNLSISASQHFLEVHQLFPEPIRTFSTISHPCPRPITIACAEPKPSVSICAYKPWTQKSPGAEPCLLSKPRPTVSNSHR